MSYEHFQHELTTEDASVATAAVVAEKTAGYQPFTVRAVALAFTIVPSAAGVITIKHRPTAGSATGETIVDTISYNATNGAAGKVVYVDGLSQKVLPGEAIVAEVTDATPISGTCDIHFFVEPSWEHPSNNADMAESA